MRWELEMRFEKSQLSPERQGSGSRWQVTHKSKGNWWSRYKGRGEGCLDKDTRGTPKSEFNDGIK